MAAPWRAAWAAAAVLLALATAAEVAKAKPCTNQVTASHTVQARLQASPEWRRRERDEPLRHSHDDHHHHLNPTDEAAWMDLMPPRGGLRAAAAAEHEEFDWAMLYRSLVTI
ncbi:unnamed protein product [Urochloa humidicola]